MFVCVWVYPSICLSVNLTGCQSMHMICTTYIVECLSVYLSICLSMPIMYNVYVCLPIFVPQLSMSLFIIQSVSQNLTEIQFTNALDLGKVLWNGRYLSKYVKMSLSIYLAIHLSLFVYVRNFFLSLYIYVFLYIYLSLTFCKSVSVPVYLSLSMSLACLSICLSAWIVSKRVFPIFAMYTFVH